MRVCHAERSRAAVALESCVMAVIHNEVFVALAQPHQAENIALHSFLEQPINLRFAAQVQTCKSRSVMTVCIQTSHPYCRRLISSCGEGCQRPIKLYMSNCTCIPGHAGTVVHVDAISKAFLLTIHSAARTVMHLLIAVHSCIQH